MHAHVHVHAHAHVHVHVHVYPALFRPDGAPPLALLDVGSCSSMFEGQRCIAATACDLCPEAGHPTTMQCDFLRLDIGAPGALPTCM